MPLPFPKKNIPSKIEPCPIMDASVEVRFETNIPSAAIFGMLYSSFQQEYSEQIEQLPILQIPEDVRNADENLKYQPHYRIKNKDFVIQIGPKVLSIGSIGSYPGWNSYKVKIIDAFTKLKTSGITSNISRLGLRYINFFENVDVFEKLDSSVFSKSSVLVSRNSFVRTEFLENELIHILQIGNSSILVMDNVQKNGSMIDVDVSRTINLENFFDKIDAQVSHLHDVEKEIFFGVLSDEYLKNYKISNG